MTQIMLSCNYFLLKKDIITIIDFIKLFLSQLLEFLKKIHRKINNDLLNPIKVLKKKLFFFLFNLILYFTAYTM